jgi:hypothetical protein
MHTKNLLKLLLVALVAANAAGCSTQDRRVIFRPQGTAPHDPPQGRMLFEQIPNWDNAAQVRCGGHLTPEDRKPGQSRWC